jgi:hypothetical protein
LTSCGRTSIRFSVQGKGTHCGSCYCSIIYSGAYISCSCGNWPFSLIVSIQSERKKYSHTPRSDIHISVDQLVYHLVEVESENNQCDRKGMLHQAAWAARLGRRSYNGPFIVMALYIENSGRVTRYFVFNAMRPIIGYAHLNRNNPVFSHWFF